MELYFFERRLSQRNKGHCEVIFYAMRIINTREQQLGNWIGLENGTPRAQYFVYLQIKLNERQLWNSFHLLLGDGKNRWYQTRSDRHLHK